MQKLAPATEQFQHFVSNLRESFWGDLNGRTREAWKKFFEADSERQRDRFAVVDAYERNDEQRRDYRNGYYERDFVTVLGTLRLRIARTRGESFLPAGIEEFQRRAPEVSLLIREAFLRGISTRQVGRVVAIVTGETVSAQTVSKLTRDLDEAVQQFHEAPLTDDWAYLFLDGVNLKVRRESGRKCVQMLVAYGVRRDGRRELLSFMRSQGESQGAWEGLLNDLYRRGLRGKNLLLIITDGCPGLAGAIQTVYPRALHQRCWVHKMRNITDKGRVRDRVELKQMAQAIYQAKDRRAARAAFRRFKLRWQSEYPTMVKQLEQDLPNLLSFFSFPKHLWKQLRTTNIIERCFVEVRRRTRPMVCFVNVQSVDRIIYSIFYRFNLEWKTRTLEVFTQAA
ncbi:MAG TPA: IS256 family transposase [Pyrinomonadaceae bacterium]